MQDPIPGNDYRGGRRLLARLSRACDEGMPMPLQKTAPNILKIGALSREIAGLQVRRAALRQQSDAANKKVLTAGVGYAYRWAQQALRRPSRSYVLWLVGVMLVGPLIAGGLALTAVSIATGSTGLALVGFLAAGIASGGLLACLLFLPSSGRLRPLVEAASRQLRSAQDEANSLRVELSRADHALRTTTQARDEMQQSVQYKRELLLEQNWKTMRGPEWEVFLAKVFCLVGGAVELTRARGDQGVDLIVAFNDRRYAVQAKGYVKSVGNSAVQEVVAGMTHHQCNRCAVITNSGFTAGAIALAKSNGCLLLGEEQIPSLVLAQLSL